MNKLQAARGCVFSGWNTLAAAPNRESDQTHNDNRSPSGRESFSVDAETPKIDKQFCGLVHDAAHFMYDSSA